MTEVTSRIRRSSIAAESSPVHVIELERSAETGIFLWCYTLECFDLATKGQELEGARASRTKGHTHFDDA